MGSGVGTNQLMKMVAGAINPGRPVANLYVSITFLHPRRSVTDCQLHNDSSRCGVMMSWRRRLTSPATSRWASTSRSLFASCSLPKCGVQFLVCCNRIDPFVSLYMLNQASRILRHRHQLWWLVLIYSQDNTLTNPISSRYDLGRGCPA